MRISDWSSDVCSSDLFDHIVCESTYGDQTRKQYTIRQRRTLLQGEIREAIAAGGNLVIPVFALERTQELLLDIASLINAGRLPRVPVYIDSPLAGRAKIGRASCRERVCQYV